MTHEILWVLRVVIETIVVGDLLRSICKGSCIERKVVQEELCWYYAASVGQAGFANFAPGQHRSCRSEEVSLTISGHYVALNLWLFWDTSKLPGGNKELIGKSLERNYLPLNSSGVISLYLNFIPYLNICRILCKLFYLLEFKSPWTVAF